MKWILLIIATYGETVTIEQVPMQSQHVCNKAANVVNQMPTKWTNVQTTCIQSSAD